MKAYAYRLEALLRVRRTQVLLARHEMARARRALEAATEAEAVALRACHELGADADPLSGAAFLARVQQGDRLAAAAALAAGRRARCEVELDGARARLLASDRAETALARLDDRRRAEWLAGLRREEAALLDELVTARAATGTTAGRP